VSCAGCATVTCRGESADPRAGCPTAVSMVARHLTIPYSTAHLWRATSWLGIGDMKAQVHLCREDVRVDAAGKTNRLHTFYD
jgi:hypothetical protein